MSFIKDSYKYFFQNFFRLFIICLPVSVLVGFFDIYRPISFFKACLSQGFTSYWEMFHAFTQISWVALGTFIAFIPLLIFTISICLAGEECHMRTGKFSFKNAFKRSVYYFVPVLSLVLIFIVICAVLVFLIPAVNYFLYYLLSGSGNVMNKTTFIACLAITLLFCALAFVFLTIFLNAINFITINNYSIKSALSLALSQLEGKFFKFFVNLIVPYVIIIPVVFLTNSYVFYPIIACVLFAAQACFSLSLCMVTYFNLTGTQRKDNNKGYFIKG